MGFTRQEYWSELPFPPPGDLLDSGMELGSPCLAGGLYCTTGEAQADAMLQDFTLFVTFLSIVMPGV